MIMGSMGTVLEEYPAIIEQPVAWGDQDMHGHVNNVWIFKYIENARVAYYEKIGKYEYERQTGVGFVLASTECRFRRPLVYPATVLVGARVSKILSDRMIMAYRLVSPPDGAIAVEAAATLVSFDYRTDQKTRFPDELKRRIEDLQRAQRS
jgi:acyl-CoA thioester hydrolase